MNLGIVNATPQLQKNTIWFSSVYHLETPKRKADKIGIKYVLKGCESYEVNGKIHDVRAGQYLLINEGSDYYIHLSKEQLNEGLCLYVEKESLQQAWYDLQMDDKLLLDDAITTASPEIHELVYHTEEDILGIVLKRLGETALQHKGRLPHFGEEDYYRIAQKVAASQSGFENKLRRLPVKNPSVQKEMYRRISTAQLFIEDKLYEPLSIEQLALVAQLSPFHFIRSFKQVYGSSPHQYIIERRLQEAMKMLQAKKNTISQIAALCGFGDVFSFSKRFKKRYGVAPTYFIEKWTSSLNDNETL